jgi:hypothetical protein
MAHGASDTLPPGERATHEWMLRERKHFESGDVNCALQERALPRNVATPDVHCLVKLGETGCKQGQGSGRGLKFVCNQPAVALPAGQSGERKLTRRQQMEVELKHELSALAQTRLGQK